MLKNDAKVQKIDVLPKSERKKMTRSGPPFLSIGKDDRKRFRHVASKTETAASSKADHPSIRPIRKSTAPLTPNLERSSVRS